MYAGRITLVGTEKGLGVNNSGTWSAEDNLTLDWNGDLKNSGTIYSKGNTDLRANYLENDKTIAAERNLSAAAKENIRNQGKLLAGENMDIYAGKTLDNAGHAMESGNNLSIETGDAINNAAGTIKSGGSQQIKAGHTLTNTEGTLAADGNINIQTGRMTGDGIVSAGKKAGILLEKDFTNTGRLEAGSSLSLAVKGNITNRKEILSRGHLALESKNIRNEETGEIKGADTETVAENTWVNHGLVNGENVHIRANHITNENTGRIYGTRLSVETHTLDNLGTYKEKAPVIASREHMNLSISGTLTNTEHALIRAEGNLTIGGQSDENGKITGKTEKIENRSAYLESGGNMAIGVNHLENRNEHFSTKNVLTGKTHHEEAVGQGQTDRFTLGGKGTEGAAYIERHGHVDHLYTPDGGDYDHFTTYIYDRSVYEDRIDTTDPAHIAAGGSLSLEAGRAVNDRSVMTAGKTLTLHGADIENRDEKGHKTVKEEGTATSYWTKRVHHGAHIHKRTETRTTRTDYMPADAVTDTTVIAAVHKAHTSPVYEGAKAEAYLSPSERKPLHISDSSLYHVTSDPTARYLVETDPAYADRKTFLSSDYFFRRMQYDPEKLEKRLGDGYYESQIVRDRLMQLKGKPAGETEYKALMDAAVRWAQENKDVRIGMALTEDQKADLKEDIVWMVESSVLLPDGNIVKALVPEVYLAHGKNGTLTGSALISAENIDIRATNDILSRGTVIAGDTMRLSASDINNEGGTIKASTLMEEALGDIRNTGTMEAENKLSLKAGQDIDLASTLHKERNQQGYTETIASSGKAAVTGNQGTLSIEAGRDITAEAAEISSAGNIAMKAGRDITMGTAAVKKDTTTTWDRNNYRHDSAARDIGASVTAKGSLTMQSERDISIKAADIRSEGMTAVEAGRNLTVENGKEITDLEEHHRHKERSLLSSTTTTTHDEVHAVQAQKSIIEGNTVSMQGGKDISLTGSAAASTKETALSAGRNISIHAAEETDKEIHKKQVKKSGLIGSGLGFTIGSEKKKDAYDTEETMQAGSTVGSIKGNVTITAGQTASVSASDIIAGKDTLITGRNVDIESKDNTYRGKEEHEYKKSGLTASLGGTVMNAARSMTAPMKRAGEVKDSRLKALYAYEAGKNLKQASDTFHSVKDVKKGLALTVGVGSMKSESHSLRTGTEAASSTLAAGGNVSVTADRDITVKGSTITGEKVNLKAGRNIYVQAEESTRTARTDEKAKGGAVSVSFGASGFQGLSASYGKGTNHETETTLTHAGSRIKAGDTLAVDSGKDTVITGSLLKGKYVSVHTGGDLSIESLQDSKTYTQNGKSIGLGIGTNLTKAGTVVQAGKGKENTDSTYRSVTEQAGIYAGSKGYDITVKGNTHLTGAVIDSKAEKEKNKLTTGTLTWEDIENKASYESHGKTQTVSSDKVSSSNPLGASVAMAVPVQGSHSSITRVAIADGIIQTTEGKTEKEISRDTKNTLNKLAEIFDKKSVQEKQELIGLIAKEGFTLVGDIATRKQESLRTKAAEARTHNNEAKAESYEKEAAKWAENGINRIALHGIVGALVSKEAGTGVEKGLTGAGLNAALQGALKNISDPEVRKAASLAIGQAVAGETGSAIAEYATVFNWLSHQQQEMRDKLISEAEAEGDMDKAERIRAYYQELDEKQDDVIRKLELPESDDYSPSVEAAIIESTNIYEDTDAFREVTIGALKIAKEKGLTEYHFLDEDYVTLNASIGMGIGLSGGFIMDRTGNVYSVVGGGFTGGIGGTIATGKLAMDTSGWTAANLQQALSGGSVSFGLGIGGSVTVNVSKVAGSREIGGTTGISAGMTGTYTQFICNINDL